jgi:uncharacterized protein (TIGR03067 family)
MPYQWMIAVVVLGGSLGAVDDGKKEAIEGVWLPSKAVMGGQEMPEEVRKTIRLELEGDEYVLTLGPATDKGTFKLDPAASPKALDITGTDGPNKGKTILAIYERDGDTLRICYDLTGKTRPTEFKSEQGKPDFLVEYQLEKR